MRNHIAPFAWWNVPIAKTLFRIILSINLVIVAENDNTKDA
jgi:hypothetical protein